MVDFLHQDTSAVPEKTLALFNAYRHANIIRDWLLDILPEYPSISHQSTMPIFVNTLSDCFRYGAWYDQMFRSLNFCPATAERANTAFGSVVHHEFGHHIVSSGFSGQDQYGEGMADTVAMLYAKDPRGMIGYDRYQCDTWRRSADNSCQFSEENCSVCPAGTPEEECPCGSEAHLCGQLLSGTIWDMWMNVASMDNTNPNKPADPDDYIRRLVLSSIPMHRGVEIDESIAIDLLTLDDDDGILENGTPRRPEICSAFEKHGMSCLVY